MIAATWSIEEKENINMSNKLVKNRNLENLTYGDLGLDARFQYLEAPYLEDDSKMLFKVDDIEQYCWVNLSDPQFSHYSCMLFMRKNGTAVLAWNNKIKDDILCTTIKTNPDNYKEIGDIMHDIAVDTYGHYFAAIVILVEVKANTYKMIEK